MALPLDDIDRELASAGPGDRREPAFLAASRTDPRFWPELLEAQAACLSAPAKSMLGCGYDLFHDAVLRHRARRSTALGWFEQGSGWRELSFEELALWVNARARAWRQAGAVKGQTLAVVRPFGPEAILSLFAAFRLGLVPSIMPPCGAGRLQHRLERLLPAHVDCAPAETPLLGAWRARRLPSAPPSAGSGAAPEASNSYAAGSVALRVFDPAGACPDVPVDVAADALFLGAVRDGLIALGLRPGTGLLGAALPTAAQPALLLACLMNGAPYFHLDAADLERDRALLAGPQARVLVLGGPPQEASPVDLRGRYACWYRGAGEQGDAASWQAFTAAAHLEGELSGAIRFSAPLGSLALFSARSRAPVSAAFFPSPGVKVKVVDGQGGTAMTGAGTLALAPPGGETLVATENQVLLQGGTVLFAGPRYPGRGGETFPRAEVLSAVDCLEGDTRASLVEVPLAKGHSFDLLLFTGAIAKDAPRLEAEARAIVAEAVGGGWLPDRVRVYPLFARTKDGKVDHLWCREQYLTGALDRRSRSPVQAALTSLRAALGLGLSADS